MRGLKIRGLSSTRSHLCLGLEITGDFNERELTQSSTQPYRNMDTQSEKKDCQVPNPKGLGL